MLTLYVTPVFYVYMDRFQQRLTRRRGPKRGEPVVASQPPATESVERVPATAALRLRDV